MAVSTTSLTKEWPEQGQWTYEDWARLPNDGKRYEVINGVLYMAPAPALGHQWTSIRLAGAMLNHADAHGLGWVFAAPVDVRLPTQPVPLQPDIVFVRSERETIFSKQEIDGAPDLVVEILSPASRTYDRQTKFQVYQAAGVPEYWLVDPQTQTINVYVLVADEYESYSEADTDGVVASRVLAGFTVPVASLFRTF